MRFIATVDSDVGIVKETNQDSVVLKHASTSKGEVLMAAVCDGMGGLEKGELASKTVVMAFANWFEQELPYELETPDMDVIGAKWSLMLKDLNLRLAEYGRNQGTELGTTFTGVLFIGENYVCVHVGDTRLYHIGGEIRQLTDDQTFIEREIRSGRMTEEQAKKDKRRNVLLQCVGASQILEPQVICGKTERGVYMICSDGFRHAITEGEMLETLAPVNLMNKKAMHGNARYLIDLIKARRERDNISVVLIKAD